VLAIAMLLSLATFASAEQSAEINMFISQPEYADQVRALIDAYKEVAPSVTINYETTQNDYPTLLKTKINAGECPDIFSTTSGKEIGVYLDYSYNFADQPAAAAMQDSVKAVMMSGDEVHGFALKSNYFGIVYNKKIFDEVGITEFPSTVEAMKAACEKLSAAGYQPFSTGFAEWWVYKHVFQHFLDAASDNPENGQKFGRARPSSRTTPSCITTSLTSLISPSNTVTPSLWRPTWQPRNPPSAPARPR
jgi:raffinose/stachyose/melibiose transport system substrate-binding protein